MDEEEPPKDFNVLSAEDYWVDRIFLGTQQPCPLCDKLRKTFFCATCLRAGHFNHSHLPDHSLRFCEKKQKLYELKKERLKVLQRCEELSKTQSRIKSLKVAINRSKERIHLLQAILVDTEKAVHIASTFTANLKEENEVSGNLQQAMGEQLQRTRRRRDAMDETLIRHRRQLDSVCTDLKQIVQSKIADLTQWIFPIAKVLPDNSRYSDSSNNSLDNAMAEAIADATCTSYVRGRWVLMDQSTEVQYRIVEPLLLGNGDYSAYGMWVNANKDAATPDGKNPAHAIAAALTYTTQLVSVMTYFLNVRLPKQLCYGEFCSHELPENLFLKKVAKLNMNIVHLCMTQNVDPSRLHPRQTIANLLLLLNPESSDLGRCGGYEYSSHLAISMEDSLLQDLTAVASDSSDSETETLEGDWETVPVSALPSIPENNPVNPPNRSSFRKSGHVGKGTPHSPTRRASEPSMTTLPSAAASVAGGLVTSAATSFATWWKAAIGK